MLKGGIRLYGFFTEEFTRATTDIDLLGEEINNEVENMKAVLEEIFKQECDDPITFKLDALKVSNITEFKECHGLYVSILVFLDRTRISVSIDIGVGDIIYSDRVEMNYPTRWMMIRQKCMPILLNQRLRRSLKQLETGARYMASCRSCMKTGFPNEMINSRHGRISPPAVDMSTWIRYKVSNLSDG